MGGTFLFFGEKELKNIGKYFVEKRSGLSQSKLQKKLTFRYDFGER